MVARAHPGTSFRRDSVNAEVVAQFSIQWNPFRVQSIVTTRSQGRAGATLGFDVLPLQGNGGYLTVTVKNQFA